MTMTDQDLELASPEAAAALLSHQPDLEQALAYFHQYIAPPTAINLSVAENVLLYQHSLKDRLGAIKLIPERSTQYQPSMGTPDLRKHVAALLTRAFGPKVNPNHVFGVAGVSSALECVAFALKGLPASDKPLKDGDGVLIPAPYWQGFNWSFETRPKLKCVPVNLPTTGDKRFQLTLKLIQDAYAAQKKPPRLLVLTNPHNPLGVNYPKALLEEIYTWALGHDLHVISDEIYCHSQVAGATRKFTSAVALDAYKPKANAARIHVVWGFAKDFGLSGFRTGFVISTNETVAHTMTGAKTPKPVQALPWFSPFDSLKTYTMDSLLTATVDGTKELYTTQAMTDYPRLLTESFETVKAALDKAKIAYVHHDGDNAAQFFWLDLTKYLGKHCSNGEDESPVVPVPFAGTDKDEDWLYRYLMAKPTEVTLLPGTVMHSPAPGFFRMCYTARPAKEVVAAVNRMATALSRLK